MKRVLLIDNYDSFTYNLAQALWCLDAEVDVHRNDEISLEQAEAIAPTHIVISPGPGEPRDAGVSMSLIQQFAGRIPLLGVCLGHQAIGEVFGGRVVRASRLMHGKSSMLEHDGTGLYEGLSSPLEIGRYHSLTVEEATLPAVLRITCRTLEGEIMGFRHRQFEVEGVQFHPESVLTPDGPKLLANFLKRSAQTSVQEASR